MVRVAYFYHATSSYTVSHSNTGLNAPWFGMQQIVYLWHWSNLNRFLISAHLYNNLKNLIKISSLLFLYKYFLSWNASSPLKVCSIILETSCVILPMSAINHSIQILYAFAIKNFLNILNQEQECYSCLVAKHWTDTLLPPF